MYSFFEDGVELVNWQSQMAGYHILANPFLKMMNLKIFID